MSNKSEFISSILKSCKIKFELPPVILPGKGVCITDTANMLAEAYEAQFPDFYCGIERK